MSIETDKNKSRKKSGFKTAESLGMIASTKACSETITSLVSGQLSSAKILRHPALSGDIRTLGGELPSPFHPPQLDASCDMFHEVGFSADAQIVTQRGAQAICTLRKSDLVLTRDRGFQPLQHCMRMQHVPGDQNMACIPANHFAPGVPARDVYLGQGQGIVPPMSPVSSKLTFSCDFSECTWSMPKHGVVQLLMNRHDLILVEGIWVETTLPERVLRSPSLDAYDQVSLDHCSGDEGYQRISSHKKCSDLAVGAPY